MSSHALLGASSASRWLNCPPSARLSENYADTQSEYAAEGTKAHDLAEKKLAYHLGKRKTKPKCDDTEMGEATDTYVDYVLEQYKTATQDAFIAVEQRVDYSRFVPEGFGTADAIIITDGLMQLIDLKFGKGIPVPANENPQLMLYALDALEMFGCLYDITDLKLTIVQPRLDSISSYEMTSDELYSWAEHELKPKAQVAWKGEGEYQCGDWCRWCRAKAECRARAEANLKLAAYEFEPPPLLEPVDIAHILTKVDELVAWAGDIKDFALTKVLQGEKYSGFKLVAGRSNRKFTDEDAVAETVKALELDPYEHKLLGITAMEKLLGKKRFNEKLGDYVIKPDGKPTLVPESDKREAMNITSAADDFAD